jgi:predicted nucleotidyltransferase
MDPRVALDKLVRSLGAELGDNLIGAFLHGSLALGCHNPALSDVDILVVIRRSLTREQRKTIEPLLAQIPRLEMHFLAEPGLVPWRHPAPYDAYYGSEGRLIGPGEDRDLAAHLTVAREAGVALLGPPPAEVLPQIPWEHYEDALLRDLDWCRDHATELYGVLSPARIWATLDTVELHSKESGAAWALERAPAEFQPLLERALETYRTGDREVDFERAEVTRFADFVLAQLRFVHMDSP